MFSRSQIDFVHPSKRKALSTEPGEELANSRKSEQTVISLRERSTGRIEQTSAIATFEPQATPRTSDSENGGSGGSPTGSGISGIKGWSFLIVTLVIATIGVFGAFQWYSYASTHESTDDAYTTGHLHAISSRISGTVESVMVDDNEHVKKGQVLFLLDPRDYQVRVDSAMAALQTARNQAEAAKRSIDLSDTTANGKNIEAAAEVSNAESNIKRSAAVVLEATSAIPESRADLAARRAEELRAATDYERYRMLADEGAVSYQLRDQALRDYKVAQEAVKAAAQVVNQMESRLHQARENEDIAKAQLLQSKGVLEQARATHFQTAVDSSQYEVARSRASQALADLKQAQLDLSYTRVVAPIDGRVGKKTVEEGQRIAPGQQVMRVVSDEIWVVANFKETQLEHMRQGQPVDVQIDSFPKHKFSGIVDSVSPGSGATFALLPPDNATGNFTKIVQRVPVKVVLDKASLKGYEQLVVPGMSAVVTVKVHK